MNTQDNYINKQQKNKGVIEVIIIIILAAAILIVFDINPARLWSEFIRPILESAWEIFLSAIAFLIDVGVWIANKLGLAGSAK